mmetsp:Transcript_41/g.202  ORF Transcript_41/g.202 Transcript_41/m.202 type:complete len:238 (-) Transcript_41:28-741(-)
MRRTRGSIRGSTSSSREVPSPLSSPFFASVQRGPSDPLQVRHVVVIVAVLLLAVEVLLVRAVLVRAQVPELRQIERRVSIVLLLLVLVDPLVKVGLDVRHLALGPEQPRPVLAGELLRLHHHHEHLPVAHADLAVLRVDRVEELEYDLVLPALLAVLTRGGAERETPFFLEVDAGLLGIREVDGDQQPIFALRPQHRRRELNGVFRHRVRVRAVPSRPLAIARSTPVRVSCRPRLPE